MVRQISVNDGNPPGPPPRTLFFISFRRANSSWSGPYAGFQEFIGAR